MKRICAVVKRAKTVFIFDTEVQSFVENFMIDVGYGNRDYFLCFREKLGGLLPPRRRFRGHPGMASYKKSLVAAGYSWTEVRVVAHASTRADNKRGMVWTVKKVHYEIG